MQRVGRSLRWVWSWKINNKRGVLMTTTLNKHGIPVQTKTARQQRVEMLEGIKLPTRRFALIDDEAEVEVVVPCFSPIVELLKGDGWREIV